MGMLSPFAVVVALLTPVAAAMAAWFGHVVLRGTRVSEMRQKWIDDQRTDLALVISRAHVLVELTQGPPTLNEARAHALGELEAAAFRIKLRENPIKPEWSPIIDRIERIRELVRDPTRSGTSLSSLVGGVVPLSRARLKTGWNLVRDGEVTYREASRRFWWWFGVLGVFVASVLTIGAYTGDERPDHRRIHFEVRCSARCEVSLP